MDLPHPPPSPEIIDITDDTPPSSPILPTLPIPLRPPPLPLHASSSDSDDDFEIVGVRWGDAQVGADVGGRGLLGAVLAEIMNAGEAGVLRCLQVKLEEDEMEQHREDQEVRQSSIIGQTC